MQPWLEVAPWLVAMAILIVVSAFFSGSEAALFSLRAAQRQALPRGGPASRLAAVLLRDPDRLLSVILFWNLVVNVAYFSIVSIVSISLEKFPATAGAMPVLFGFGALMTMIFCSEMLPKTIAVTQPARWTPVLAFPLAFAVRIASPVLPILRGAMVLSRRVIWPGFRPEKYLEVADLERAIELSGTDAALMSQEQTILRNIVQLSEIRADEWMRPRTQFLSFPPTFSLADLDGKITPSGYLLITEPDSEEIAAEAPLNQLIACSKEEIERLVRPVVIAPWCASVADVLQKMQRQGCEVAAIVNEYGETIGVLTFEDVLDTVFTFRPSRSKRLLDQNPVHQLAENVWLVAGVTSIRRLCRLLQVEHRPSKSVTVAGLVQEHLGKLAEPGDECEAGAMRFRVLEVAERGNLIIRVTVLKDEAT
ncbi:MAG: hemolysin family protein [bacterium]|nr:hemolysin family protein [bacterium]